MIRVLGANIAALTFCDELSRRGVPFEVIPLGSPGSGWAGLVRNGELLDLGQRYFELDFEANEKRPLEEYDERQSHRDFVHHVRDFITGHGYELEEARVEAYFRGKIITCPLETTDLTALMECLTLREKDQIVSELHRKEPVEGLEMSRIGYGSATEFDLNLKEMLNYNHGPTFNELIIYPFIDKFGLNPEKVPMRLRRKLWAPIFYSNTILDFCHGRESYKPNRPHFKLKGQSTSTLVNHMTKMASQPARKIIGLKDGDLILEGGGGIPGDEIYFGSSLEAIAGILGISLSLKKVRIRLIWFKIDEADVLRPIDYLSVMDAGIPFLRVSCSSQSADAGKVMFCAESFDLGIEPKDVLDSLKEMGLISESCTAEAFCDLSAPVLDEPTFENERMFNAVVDAVRSLLPGMNLRLANLTFSKNTLNDQVLLGLKLAREAGVV